MMIIQSQIYGISVALLTTKSTQLTKMEAEVGDVIKSKFYTLNKMSSLNPSSTIVTGSGQLEVNKKNTSERVSIIFSSHQFSSPFEFVDKFSRF